MTEEEKNLQQPQDGNQEQNNNKGTPVVDETGCTKEKVFSFTDEPQPQTTNSKLQTAPMEVHNHGHVHEKKKWKEYVFQFLMLFLAVFCGFFAEYQLEHKIEKERGEELSRTLFEELKSDSANLSQSILNRKDKEEHLQYLGRYFRDSNLVQLSYEFYPRYTWGIFMNSYIVFEPKDGMLEQLKNSGSLRFFKNMEIQKAVGNFSVAINNLRLRNEREGNLLGSINRDMLLKHYDFHWLNQITKNGELTTIDALKIYETKKQIIPAGLINLESIDKKETTNYMNYCHLVLRSTRLGQMKEYQETSNRLIKLLREEYRLQ